MSELAPEGAPEPAVEAEAPIEEAAAPEYVSRDDYDQLANAVGYLAEQFQQARSPQERQQLDPLADNFQQQLDQYLNERLAPIAETTQQYLLAEGEDRAKDILADIAAREGDYDQTMARDLAERYLPQEQARFGNTPKAAEAALNRAASTVREWEAKVGKAAIEREGNQLATLAGAPRTPSQPGRPATQQVTTVQGGDETSVLHKYFPIGGSN